MDAAGTCTKVCEYLKIEFICISKVVRVVLFTDTHIAPKNLVKK